MEKWGSLSLKRKRCWLWFIQKKLYITLHCMLERPPSPQLYMRELEENNSHDACGINWTKFIKFHRHVKHQDFPGDHPYEYYAILSALNCIVLMGSISLTLWSRNVHNTTRKSLNDVCN
jgi:hypothetical protein